MTVAPKRAADSVWALVSGLPSGRRGRRLFMVLQACIDDSGDDQALILAGYISTAEKWAAFSNDWADLLTMRPPWSRFKMSEIMARSQGSRSWPDVTIRERIAYHHGLIQDHALAGICIAIPRAPLTKVVKELGLPDQIANPYFLAWRTIISMCHFNQRSMGFDEPIDFIFDYQSELPLVLSAWSDFSAKFPKELTPLVRNPPIPRRDDDFLPLQAADMHAWWMRKRYRHHGTILIEESPFPWPHRDGPPSLLGELDESGIRRQLLKDRDALSRRMARP